MGEKNNKVVSLDEATFKRLLGVKRKTFEKMVVILEAVYREKHKKGGKPPKLNVKDKLMITLQYLREYRTMEHIGFDYGVCKSAISDSIRWVEDTLIKDGTFSLPGKKALRKKTAKVSYLVVDCTESPVERPKKKQKRCYSGKKRHTIKTQVVINRRNGDIISVDQDFGHVHDFKLFKQSIGGKIDPSLGIDADLGYKRG
jgi:hypothetical protein